MTVDEIPPGEQLMKLPAWPSASSQLRFLFVGMSWPDAGTLERQASKFALANRELVDDTIEWIERVLKPEWVAPDLETRMLAATGVVDGSDAFLARYALEETKIQVIVTKFSVYLVISPGAELVPLDPIAAARTFLNVEPDPEVPWTGGPWSVSSVEGFTFGYQGRAFPVDWPESLNYLATVLAVKFSIKKIQRQSADSRPNKTISPPEPEQAEKQWFETVAARRKRR